MNENQQVRDTVSKFYAKAVNAPGGGGSCCAPADKQTVIKLAGYGREELDELPPEAVANSFGCGNPFAFMDLDVGQTVLDLGSGAGIDVLLAAKKVGPTGHAIGVDMTDEMIAKAKENIATSGLENVEVRKGTIEELPVESSSVDWVISNCVINLSPEKPRVFAEIVRVLKPGGQLLVSDVVVEDLPAWVKQDEGLYSTCIAGAISEREYVGGLRAAGLEDVEIRDRVIYDASQLEAFVHSDQAVEAAAKSLCCGGARAGTTIKDVAQALAGKVASIRVYARKPA